jgi:polyketide biosynthesis enoyl-CoA hydratase PksH
MSHETITVTTAEAVCRIRLNRPAADNAINAQMIAEIGEVLARCTSDAVSVIVLEGGAEVFCAGGDFQAVSSSGSAGDPAPLYDLWLTLTQGPSVTIALVHGRVNAGGVGFVAACDIAIAGRGASFGLSELLFGLYPACVLPFLVQRIGRQRAHYLTLMTRPIGAVAAHAAGLVDVVADDPETVLRQHLTRLRHLRKPAIAQYKAYLGGITGDPVADRARALDANRAIFADADVIADIRRYVTELKLPWET